MQGVHVFLSATFPSGWEPSTPCSSAGRACLCPSSGPRACPTGNSCSASPSRRTSTQLCEHTNASDGLAQSTNLQPLFFAYIVCQYALGQDFVVVGNVTGSAFAFECVHGQLGLPRGLPAASCSAAAAQLGRIWGFQGVESRWRGQILFVGTRSGE